MSYTRAATADAAPRAVLGSTMASMASEVDFGVIAGVDPGAVSSSIDASCDTLVAAVDSSGSLVHLVVDLCSASPRARRVHKAPVDFGVRSRSPSMNESAHHHFLQINCGSAVVLAVVAVHVMHWVVVVAASSAEAAAVAHSGCWVGRERRRSRVWVGGTRLRSRSYRRPLMGMGSGSRWRTWVKGVSSARRRHWRWRCRC